MVSVRKKEGEATAFSQLALHLDGTLVGGHDGLYIA